MNKLPFNFLPEKILSIISFKLRGFGKIIEKTLPTLKIEVQEIGLEKKAIIYFSKIISVSISYFILCFLILIGISQFTVITLEKALVVSITFSLIISMMIYLYLLAYPKILIKKKIRNLEINWVYALRTLLVQIRSGLNLYDALIIITKSNYGEASKEISKVVEKISSGYLEVEALEELASRNPSKFFRRSIWQLINGMRSGTNTQEVLEGIVKNMTAEEKIQIKKYGSQLGILTLVYVMLGTVIPVLGMAFLIILSNFPQISLGSEILWYFLMLLAVTQFMYLGVIKSTRPSLIQ